MVPRQHQYAVQVVARFPRYLQCRFRCRSFFNNQGHQLDTRGRGCYGPGEQWGDGQDEAFAIVDKICDEKLTAIMWPTGLALPATLMRCFAEECR